MLNKVILIGRLTRDPELRYTSTNYPVCSFSIAVDRSRKSPSGERLTDFFNCVSWNKQAEFVSQWFTKGMLVAVVGRIEPRQWQDKSGNNRISVEIQCEDVSFVESKKAREAAAAEMGDTMPSGNAAPAQSAASDVSPSFDLPADGDDFRELEDDESTVPF